MTSAQKRLLYGILAILIVVAVLAITDQLGFLNYRRGNITTHLSLRKMWEEEEFLKIIEVTTAGLADEPLHPTYLLYDGLAHYYIANASASQEDQDMHIDRSIARLRKLLLIQQPPQLSSVYLTLGKGYYHKGQLYYTQAIDYIERALLAGLENDEAYQYLGATYAHLGQYDKSIEQLERASRLSDSLPLKFALAEIYVISGALTDAEKLYNDLRAEHLSSSDTQQLFLLEIDLLVARQQYRDAVGRIEEFLVEHPNVADAYFKLGEAHYELNELDKARYNWRLALKTDPNHTTALRRLQR